MKEKKQTDWINKELLSDNIEDFILFAENKKWEIERNGNDIEISKGGRTHKFIVTDKWVHFERWAFPLVMAYNSGFGR